VTYVRLHRVIRHIELSAWRLISPRPNTNRPAEILAKSVGLAIPQTLRLRANQVIESPCSTNAASSREPPRLFSLLDLIAEAPMQLPAVLILIVLFRWLPRASASAAT
jgi:hypothetical protein